MPKGPRGERRPRDVVSNAVHVMRIPTGEIEEKIETPDPAKEHMRKGGLKGGIAMIAIARRDRPVGSSAPGIKLRHYRDASTVEPRGASR